VALLVLAEHDRCRGTRILHEQVASRIGNHLAFSHCDILADPTCGEVEQVRAPSAIVEVPSFAT
jgi:hypothetical protein